MTKEIRMKALLTTGLLILCIGCVGGYSASTREKTSMNTVVSTRTHEASTDVPLERAPANTIPVKHDNIKIDGQNGRDEVSKETIDRLQSLGYLPIKQARMHPMHLSFNQSVSVIYFRFQVPEQLQKTANSAGRLTLANPFVRGAIIQFERVNRILHKTGVSVGALHAAVTKKLFSRHARPDDLPFQWVTVSKATGTREPETLHVFEHQSNSLYQNKDATTRHTGWIFKTRVNTGVLGATPNGSWPIYQRLPVTTMKGVFPVPITLQQYKTDKMDGKSVGMMHHHPVFWQPYDDHGIKFVNYFDAGRGIHYYPRSSYGLPQSAGCVEVPYVSAEQVFHLLHYGDVVTVQSGVFNPNY